MSSLRLGLSRRNPSELIALGELVATKLAPSAPATPPIPNLAAKVVALTAAITQAKADNDAYEAAKAALVTLKQARDNSAEAPRAAHASTAKAVESEANGDAETLLRSGYPLAAEAIATTEPPAQVTNLSVAVGDNDGELDVSHDPVARARTYEVQVTKVDPLTGPWITRCSPTTSRCSIDGLTSGQRVWVRARAIGSMGTGPWSDPSTKIVP